MIQKNLSENNWDFFCKMYREVVSNLGLYIFLAKKLYFGNFDVITLWCFAMGESCYTHPLSLLKKDVSLKLRD